jgi:hypothetical protein
MLAAGSTAAVDGKRSPLMLVSRRIARNIGHERRGPRALNLEVAAWQLKPCALSLFPSFAAGLRCASLHQIQLPSV